MSDIRVTPEGIEVEVGPSVDVRVDGTWDDPKGYKLVTERGEFYITVDEAELLPSTLGIVLERATTLAKKRGIVSLKRV